MDAIEECSLVSHSQSAETELLANPNPSNEHVGVDDECLYIDIAPEHPTPSIPPSQSEPDTLLEEDELDEDEVEEDESESMSMSDDGVEEDDIVRDREPPQPPDASYDKNDPPMGVDTLYSDIQHFKLALATYATKYEFQYNIEKSDKSRYRVYCSSKNEGCRWRMHVSTMADEVTVKVTRNPHPHENHHSTRRAGICVGITKFWVCEQILD